MIISIRDDETEEGASQVQMKAQDPAIMGGNPFLDIPNSANTIEYKKGYVMRKCCYDSNAKRSEYLKLECIIVYLLIILVTNVRKEYCFFAFK